MPVSFYYGILLAVALAYVLGWTPLGRSMVFVGANRRSPGWPASGSSGSASGAYVAGGLLAGLAG